VENKHIFQEKKVLFTALFCYKFVKNERFIIVLFG